MIAAEGVVGREDGHVSGIPRRLLGDGEAVVMVMRPHWKALVRPVLVLLVACPAATYLVTVMPGGAAQRWLRLAVVAVAALVLLRWTVWPFLTGSPRRTS